MIVLQLNDKHIKQPDVIVTPNKNGKAMSGMLVITYFLNLANIDWNNKHSCWYANVFFYYLAAR